MDDRHAQFLITLGDACVSASLAELTLVVVTTDGTQLTGVPAPELQGNDVWGADDLTSAKLSIDGQTIALNSIITYVVHAPTVPVGRRAADEQARRDVASHAA